jgi:hypothetical protein
VDTLSDASDFEVGDFLARRRILDNAKIHQPWISSSSFLLPSGVAVS